ncbi:hypothetical protein J6590_064870 [Homalodisca vitripennis]|nr:hypothetical protein J6590_064870 [Homalodisca vitripennis]
MDYIRNGGTIAERIVLFPLGMLARCLEKDQEAKALPGVDIEVSVFLVRERAARWLRHSLHGPVTAADATTPGLPTAFLPHVGHFRSASVNCVVTETNRSVRLGAPAFLDNCTLPFLVTTVIFEPYHWRGQSLTS